MSKRKIDLCRWTVEAEGVDFDLHSRMVKWCEWGSFGVMDKLPRPAAFTDASFFPTSASICARCKPPFFERKMP